MIREIQIKEILHNKILDLFKDLINSKIEKMKI